MKMKNLILFLVIALSMALLSGCSSAKVGEDEEAVWVVQPWIFGHGGVDKEPVSTGMSWGFPTSHAVVFKIVPIRYDESFDDIFSNDNTPLDFNTYIRIRIKKGKTPVLLENYGKSWYKNNLQVEYRNKTREYVSLYSPFDLISNREVLRLIDSALIVDMRSYVERLSKSREFPIEIVSVTTGAARPNEGQMKEMDRTATAIQATKTEERRREMEVVRAESEKARALADKAYMQNMNLSSEEFIQLKYIEMIASKKDANIDVLVGTGSNPMWNIRR